MYCVAYMLFFVLKFLHTVSFLHSITAIILEYIMVRTVKQIKMHVYYSKYKSNL